MSEQNPFNPGEKDGTSQVRTVLAFVLMGAILFGMQYFFKSGTPPEKAKSDRIAAGAAPAKAGTALPLQPDTSVSVTPSPAGTLVAHDEQTTAIDTDLYHVVFSNRGAVVKSWTLKHNLNHADKPLEVVNVNAAAKVWYPFSYEFRNQKASVDLNQALFVASRSAGGLGVDFTFANAGLVARKSFEFQKDGYITQVSSDVRQNGAPLPHLLAWRGGFGDSGVQSASGTQHSIRYETASGKLESDGTKVAKDGPVNRDGQFTFVGLEDQYFAAVFLPTGNGTTQMTQYTDYVPVTSGGKDEQFIGTAVGGEGLNKLPFFLGPKDLDLLKKVNPKLEQIVDFGFFSILAKPLFLVLRYLDHVYVHNYGWSIVLITVLINFLLLPLRITNMKSMNKMKKLQPQIQAINEKYKSVGMRDPKAQLKNQETMDLYKKHGANPMAGCLPMVIQMPFLFAFYRVLSVSTEMRGASWLWVPDLSQPEHLALHLLPLILIATSFLMQRMTPTTGMDPSQARMMMMMPLVMGFFFYNQAAGLVLYWLTGNLMGIAQQYFFNKTMPPVLVLPAEKNGGFKQIQKKPGRK